MSYYRPYETKSKKRRADKKNEVFIKSYKPNIFLQVYKGVNLCGICKKKSNVFLKKKEHWLYKIYLQMRAHRLM
jgi:hypothetical protein